MTFSIWRFEVSRTYENNDMLQNPLQSFFNLYSHSLSSNNEGITNEIKYKITDDFVISYELETHKLFIGLDYDKTLFIRGQITAGFQFELYHE